MPANPLDYEKLIVLDAEDLAEGGIKEAYDALRSQLSVYVAEPAEVEEDLDPDLPRYSVRSGGEVYPIYGPDQEEGEGQSWGRAAHALFAMVNAQLADSTHRLYAINGGNDLGGLFLTPEQAEAARSALESPSDWPYIPTPEHPHYGQPH